jgi:hypothetical protein
MSEISDPGSELVELSKLNGDFRKNYGAILGAYLYLRSLDAVRGRPFAWLGLLSLLGSVASAWLGKCGWPWRH